MVIQCIDEATKCMGVALWLSNVWMRPYGYQMYG